MNCVFAKTLYTGKEVFSDAYLVFDSPKITGVSKTQDAKPEGKFAVITHAFVDPHSHIGIDDRIGTLAKGKWASFICWNGDPFDLSSYPVAVYGEGKLLFSE
jgi:imidazolonepropionase-like amidohydrolase